jgi:3,4-dihydroxy 2-butanone 4-phosphate synthase/GTP cyclohydrolase II
MTNKKRKEIERIIGLYKNGQMLIVTDNEDRENEGDLLISSDKITDQDISFMARYGRGLICVPIEEAIAKRLAIPLMTERNDCQYSTAFTISVDAKKGTTTGISASDRLKTIKTLIDENSNPEDLLKPGHMFPLIAAKGGLYERSGHTEAAVELSKLVGHTGSGVICEIMGDDGTMLHGDALKDYSLRFNLPMLTIKDLTDYLRFINEPQATFLPTDHGEFDLYDFTNSTTQYMPHIALVHKDIDIENPVTLRIHSECMTGDLFGSLRCDCGDQLKKAMNTINADKGILIYLRQEGRGIGFNKKMEAYRLQDSGMDTIEANLKLGFRSDERDYAVAGEILQFLKIKEVNLLTNNPDKISSLEMNGIKINNRIPLQTQTNNFNKKYLITKKEKMNHMLNV